MDKIFSEIKNAADKVAKKSGELVELSKIKLNMVNTKSSIDNKFKSLGELLYRSQKEDSEVTPESLQEVISEIDGLYEKLSDLDELYANLTNKKICSNCQKPNENSAAFCSRCGYNFPDEE